jgi:hypothetical protein
VYGVWQTGRHFSEQGLQPWAVSKSLDKLRAWAEDNVPRHGQKRLFFAKHNGRGQDWTDSKWKVVGHLYAKHGITVLRADPERYEANRAEGRLWGAPGGGYPDPTDQDWERKTVNIDSLGN